MVYKGNSQTVGWAYVHWDIKIVGDDKLRFNFILVWNNRHGVLQRRVHELHISTKGWNDSLAWILQFQFRLFPMKILQRNNPNIVFKHGRLLSFWINYWVGNPIVQGYLWYAIPCCLNLMTMQARARSPGTYAAALLYAPWRVHWNYSRFSLIQ